MAQVRSSGIASARRQVGPQGCSEQRLLELLLPAVVCTGGEASIALAADELVGVGLLGEHLKGGLDDATENAEHEVESRLLLDVIVRKGAAVLELFSGEDETLLIRGNAFLILDLGLHVVDCVGRLNLQCDGLASQSLNEDLHGSGEEPH